jgi:organic hydroperoxide reductase OsmC/OhrA
VPTEHRFEARLTWRKGAIGVAAHNHRVSIAGRPAIEVSAAAQYKGDPSRLNPEELFLAALASCQMLTYLALSGRSGIDVVAYEDAAEAKLAIVDRRMRIAAVTLRPRITLAPGQDAAKARALVASAHAGCFIANSVSCPVEIEPEIASATPTAVH